MTQNNTPTFRPLTGIYEPSAIQQLADGRFLVIEDEKQHPLCLVTINTAGCVSSTALNPGPLEDGDAFWKLDDLEGVALDSSGYIYAITSHSRDADGNEKKSRDKLVRFRIEGDRVVEPRLVRGLKPALVAMHSILAHAAESRDVKNDGGLNIEALEISPDQQRLLIGFRSPLFDNRAVIASIENTAAMFEAGEQPHISATLAMLDLGGNGIRGMAYIPSLAGYLLVSGPVAREQVQFQLWYWSGQHEAPAFSVTVPGLQGFEHAEGVSPAVIDDRQHIIVVSDDGNRKEGRYGGFLLIDLEELRIER